MPGKDVNGSLSSSLRRALAAISFSALVATIPAAAQNSKTDHHGLFFSPGNLVVSRSVYHNNPDNVQVGEILPPNCASTLGGCGASTGAPYDGTYPYVFNNDLYDASFGITSKIFLDQMHPFGLLINSLEVPSNSHHGDQLVTSFSSKSELALHLSTDGRYLTFAGYVAPIDQLDVSNSNTPGAVDPTNPVGETIYRAVAQVDGHGHFQFTETNAYSGNNGRGVVWNNSNGADVFYTAGNAGNGGNPQPEGIILGAGTQILSPANAPESAQTPSTPTPVGSFNITQLGSKADKIGKDDNFRGITIFNNVVYYSKGSGGNGVNTIYFLDTTGTACPNGVGLPSTSATLPTSALAYDPTTLQTTGLPSNMCILAGFPAVPNKSATTLAFPFSMWFANATTLYVADEGDGYNGAADLYTHAAAQSTAGLQKWVFNSSSNSWNLAYTLQTGLGLGVPYAVRHYPQGNNPASGLAWAPATDGLRNLIGSVDDGRVAIWAITSTVSGSGDQGADPNQLVVVFDSLGNVDPKVAARESFFTLRQAGFGEVLRGVSFTPGTDTHGER
jgi:hypothetical protein